MLFKELECIFFRASSITIRSEGEKIYSDGLVKSIKGKRIDESYHIYGVVGNSQTFDSYNTHIIINLKSKKFELVKCSCDDFREFSKEGYSFMCKHLAATFYDFLNQVSKNLKTVQKSNDRMEVVKKGKKLIRIIRKRSENKIYFECIEGLNGKKNIVYPDNLRSFLTGIKEDKIKLKYDSLEYATSIVVGKLPISFTLKERDNSFVLTTQKQFPVSLNDKNDVYIFHNRLYLPPREQIKAYLPLYEKLIKNGEMILKKTIKNYNTVVSIISSISEDVNIREEVKNFAANNINSELHIFKINQKICCDLVVAYGDRKFNILNTEKSLIRDHKNEEKILSEIEKLGFIKSSENFIFTGSDEELFDLLKSNTLFKVVLSDDIEDMKIYDSRSIKTSIYEKDEEYYLSYDFGDVPRSELKSILEAYKRNRKFYRISGFGFIDLQDVQVKDFLSTIEVLNIDLDEENDKKLQLGSIFFLEKRLKNFCGKEIIETIENKAGNKNFRVPKAFKGELREYQKEGFKWLKRLSNMGLGGILADDMGLGKTIQTIVLILSEKGKKFIIVTPTSLIYNWKNEIEKFAPDLKVKIIHGNREEDLKQLKKFDLILTSYGTLRMDMDYYRDINFDFCIIDEAQNIKNYLSQNSKVVKNINAKVKFALTGTPIENNLFELWSIFDFVMPGYLYNRDVFEKKFIEDEDNLEDLKLLISPFILRRTKEEVASELPDKIQKKFLVQMTKEQKDIYSSYIKLVKEKMKSNSYEKTNMLSYLTRLRQICLNPSILDSSYEGGSGKINIAMELIENHLELGDKMLVFSQFTSILNNIGEKLKKQEIKYFYLDGSTPAKDRIDMVDDFNQSSEVRVFLISLKAGGTGLNLTSANVVIHFDPWWNPSVENQATDRAHRIGQKNVVEVIKLIARGTIEERVVMLQEEKQELISSVITGELKDSNVLNKLTSEEIKNIFMEQD